MKESRIFFYESSVLLISLYCFIDSVNISFIRKSELSDSSDNCSRELNRAGWEHQLIPEEQSFAILYLNIDKIVSLVLISHSEHLVRSGVRE